MPWVYKTVRAQREEFALAAQQGGNFSALCREYGIIRKAGYKWVRRAQSGEALDDRNRKPKTENQNFVLFIHRRTGETTIKPNGERQWHDGRSTLINALKNTLKKEQFIEKGVTG